MPSDTPGDRAYVLARVQQMDHQLDVARDAMMGELDTYRDDWTTRHAELQRAHRERMDAMVADQAAWLARWVSGDPDEGAPTIVDQGQDGASGSGGEPATPPGPGSGQLPNQDAEMAARIARAPMSSWHEERQQYLNRPNPGLFG